MTDRARDAGFEALYRKHVATVHRRACCLLGNDCDAWEVVQDVFLSLYARPEQYAAESSLSTFMYSATTHACLNHIRNRKTRARLLEERAHEAPAPQPDAPLDPEALVLLHDMLRRLDEPLGAVAVYYYIDDLSHDEIAQLIGCSRRQIGNLLERVTAAARQLEMPC